MVTPVPKNPKIYHIVHVDRLPYIIRYGRLWCDAVMAGRENTGTVIGMTTIKQRRLRELKFTSHPELYVGQCVPFYFCPRPVMLYLIYRRNSALANQDGQKPIIHLEADLHRTIDWSKSNNRRWAYTTSNAGSYHFEDYSDLGQLRRIDWDAVQAEVWVNTAEFPNRMDFKQAEFLLEGYFPWRLITGIGVYSQNIKDRVRMSLQTSVHRPLVEVKRDWYY